MAATSTSFLARIASSAAQSATTPRAPAAEDFDNKTILAQHPDRGTVDYDVPRAATEKWPALLLPEIRYVDLSGLYPLLCFAPITTISEKYLSDADDRARLLHAARVVGYEFSPEQVTYIFERTGAGKTLRDVKRHLDEYGNKLQRFLGKGKVVNWMHEMNSSIRALYPDAATIRADEIVHHVIEGNQQWLGQMNIRYNGVISYVLGSYCRNIGKFQGSF